MRTDHSPLQMAVSLLYTRDRGDLVLRDLATGEDRVLLESWNKPDVQWLSLTDATLSTALMIWTSTVISG